MAHQYYSQRTGSNPNPTGLPYHEIRDLFFRVFKQFKKDGYFDQAFGSTCVDAGDVEGTLGDVELAMLLAVRKKHLWPVETYIAYYKEDDLFDVIEFLQQHVSKPVEGALHSYNACGMHWETFNQVEGKVEFRARVNDVLAHYEEPFELSADGYILRKSEPGFAPIFDADVPTKDKNIASRVDSAVLQYRRHGSSLDDRRQAVRDLADVLEYLRPQVKELLTSSDESDLFNIANNFGIRHHNGKQKTGYDASLWLSWMFYFYLATIHVVLRKIGHDRVI